MTEHPRASETRGTLYVNKVYSNVSQELIEITADKLKLILSECGDRMDRSASWRTPLGILLALVLCLCTGDTKAALGLNADVWEAILIILAGLSAFWVIRSLWRCRRRLTVDQIIDQVKETAER